MEVNTVAPGGSGLTGKIHITRAGGATSSVKEGLAGQSKEVRKMFKQAFDELDTIKQSADRLVMKEMKDMKDEDVFDFVGNDTPSSSENSSGRPLQCFLLSERIKLVRVPRQKGRNVRGSKSRESSGDSRRSRRVGGGCVTKMTFVAITA